MRQGAGRAACCLAVWCFCFTQIKIASKYVPEKSGAGTYLHQQLLPSCIFCTAILGKRDGSARGGRIDGDLPVGDIGTHLFARGLLVREKAATGQCRFQPGASRMGLRIDVILFTQAGKAAAAAG